LVNKNGFQAVELFPERVRGRRGQKGEKRGECRMRREKQRPCSGKEWGKERNHERGNL